MKSRSLLIVIALGMCFGALASSTSPELSQAERKFQYLERNGRSPHPNAKPTVITEPEVNAYLASDQIQMPAGVQSVKLQAEPGIINGTARIDFDRVRAGVHSSNPLLSIFSGVHEVVVNTHSYGAEGQGHAHVDSVSIDGIEVPKFVLELFVEKYLQPKYPEIGIDSQFKLPDRINSAVVGAHQVTVVQK